MKLRPDDSGRRFERNLLGCARNLMGKARKTTRAVAAHFRFTAVAVVVAHPEIRPVRRFLEQQNPIRPHPAMAIADS